MNVLRYLVDAVTQCLELLDSPSSLFIRVVSGANGSHTRWFVTGVTLSTVVEIRVGATGAVSENPSRLGISEVGRRGLFHVHTNVARHSDVRTPVGLAHDRNHGDLGMSVRWETGE
jgi:hypothetical protein